MKFINQVKKNLVNIPGWCTNKKIVVIESDDWGSISMPSKEVYEELLAKGVPVDKSFFTKYDSLESEEDLNELFNVLTKFKDSKGNHPCITACAVVANPDFQKIRESDFQQFFYEPITETYKKYPKHSKSFDIWKKGMEDHLLWPQFHGREHLNPIEWLRILRTRDEKELLCFENEALIGLNLTNTKRQMGYLAAFDYSTEEELESFENVIKEGQELFENIFGFKSTSFIAPTSIRSDKIDKYLANNGIIYHQLGRQWLPIFEAKNIIRNRGWGAKNEFGQTYWRRNCSFEPSKYNGRNIVDETLNEIKIAFDWGKPAVINSHRVNYIGGIEKYNRDNGLTQLSELLKKITEKYPDVIFMSSDQMGDFIVNNPSYRFGLKLNNYRDVKFKV